MLSNQMCLENLYIHNNNCFIGNADNFRNFFNIRKKEVKFYKI